MQLIGLYPCDMGLNVRKPVLREGADQTEHPGSLISTFVIHLLESIISELATLLK